MGKQENNVKSLERVKKTHNHVILEKNKKNNFLYHFLSFLGNFDL